MHNRHIEQRVDDSVIQLINGQSQPIRRSRGYAPSPINLPPGFSGGHPILAMGGDLKNTFCLMDNDHVLMSQFIGNLSDQTAEVELCKYIDIYRQIKHFSFKTIVVDEHPEYRSRELGVKLAIECQSNVQEIQHHHAHIAACMADNHYPRTGKPILGICMDGMGYKKNSGQIWGGEILYMDYCDFQQLATLKPCPLPGGDLANTQPWRNTIAQLHQSFGWGYVKKNWPNQTWLAQMQDQQADTIVRIIEQGQFAPLSSSVGRLFDAVAAVLGICSEGSIEYEGKAAMQLEACILESDWDTATPYYFDQYMHNNVLYIDPSSMWQGLQEDLFEGKPNSVIAARFHLGLVDAYASSTMTLARNRNVSTVALSGGVMQNQHLQTHLHNQLLQSGFDVLVHHQVPANDGGLSLGQACIARAKQLKSKEESLCA